MSLDTGNRRICGELTAYDEIKGHAYWATLANLAATCRHLSEPSLDALWRVQSSLVPLLRTMPADLWKVKRDCLQLGRPIKWTDWSRFHTYACRIRHFGFQLIGYPSDPGLYVDDGCLRALALAKPRDMLSLCPRVRSLDWDMMAMRHSETLYMPLFMGLDTIKITFSLKGMGASHLSVLQSIPRDFPMLQHIVILDDVDDKRFGDALSEFLSNNKELHTLLSGTLPPRVVQHLVDLPNLHFVAMRITRCFPSSQSLGFAQLGKLCLHSTSISTTTSLFNMMASPLRQFILHMTDTVIRSSELTNLFQAMCVHCSHPTLEHVHFDMAQAESELGLFFDESILKPLLSFVNLQAVKLYSPRPFQIGNEMIREISAAWPQLRLLTVNSTDPVNSSQITPAGLIPLLCLIHLRSLSIIVNASIVDYTLQPSPGACTINTALTHLELQNSTVENSASVAAFLSAFLPRLNKITSWDSEQVVNTVEGKKYRARWDEVARLVPIIAEVRQVERSAVVAASQGAAS